MSSNQENEVLQDDEYSDMENELLEQLHELRELKRKKKEQTNEIVNSDEEEDPRQINDRGQQPTYFKKVVKESKSEKVLKQRIIQQTKKAKTSTLEQGANFAERLVDFKNKITKEQIKQKQKEDEMLLERVYQFDLGDGFSPLNLEVDEKDMYTGKQLSKRYVDQQILNSAFQKMKLMRIEHVYSFITPPKYEPPQFSNYVIFGVIVSKSETKNTANNKSKFMKVQLSNFKQQVTVTFLGKAFEKYWKVRLGDVVAILNPAVWKYGDDEKAGFTLSIRDNIGCLLEIGHAKHFGLCKSIKKDGTVCGSPIDTSKSEYCDYHVEMQFNKTASKRLELNGSFRMFSPTENGAQQAMFMGTANSRGKESLEGQLVVDAFAPKKDRLEEVGKLYFSNPNASKAFFDNQYSNPNVMQEVKSRQLKKERAKNEAELRRKLAGMSGGTILKHSSIETQETKDERQRVTKVAFNAQVMNKIGFNPTKHMFQKSNITDDDSVKTKASNIELINQLKAESQKKEKQLAPSKQELIQKKRKWDKTVLNLKEFKENQKKSPIKKKLTNKDNMVELSSDEEMSSGDNEQARNLFARLKKQRRN